MQTKLLVTTIALFASFTGLAQEHMQSGAGKSVDDLRCGMIYGKAHVFTACAPEGWVLDNTILNDQGIYAVFYPEGSSWKEAKDKGSIMYLNTAAKGKQNANVAALMKTDAEDTIKSAPKARIREVESLKAGESVARVQEFEHGAYDRFEAVAYIDSPKIIVMMILTSKNAATFERGVSRLLCKRPSFVLGMGSGEGAQFPFPSPSL